MAYNVTEKRNKRKEQICASALEIILDGGLETLSMHTLAKRQGVTVGALYRYFRSKQELLAVLELTCLEQLSQALGDIYHRHDNEKRDSSWGSRTLWGVARGYQQYLKAFPGQARLISGILANPNAVVAESHRQLAMQHMFDVLAVPARVIRELEQAGEFEGDDSLNRALVLWITIHGIVQLEKLESLSDALINVEALLQGSVRDLYTAWSNPSTFAGEFKEKDRK